MHFIHEFSRSSPVEITSEELTDFRWLRIELLDKTADVVTVARQLRLEIIQLVGEDRLDDAGVDRLGPISNSASNARTRCWPICSGVLSLAATSVAASSVTTSSGATRSSSEALSTQSI
jgi:hypothetical protein